MRRQLPWVLYTVILLIAVVPVLYTQSDDLATAWCVFWAQLALGLGVARPWMAVPAFVTCAIFALLSDFAGVGMAAAGCYRAVRDGARPRWMGLGIDTRSVGDASIANGRCDRTGAGAPSASPMR